MPATVRDVARLAGVSVSTVSAVINQSKYVSPELEKRVRKAIDELDYVPSRLGRALSLKRSYTLAYILPSVTNPFFSRMVEVVERMAFTKGYGLFVCNSEGDRAQAEAYRQFLLHAHVDGLLISLTSELARPSIYQEFLTRGVPVVGLAGARSVPEIDSVVTDDVKAMSLLTEHLLALGHTRLGFVGIEHSHTTQLRLTGIRATLDQVGLALDAECVRLARGYREEDAYEQVRELLSQSGPPTAIICYNDVMAVGALKACNDLRLAVPDQISVTGYDDSLAEFTFPRLTTMSVPTREMGEAATELLLHRIEDKTPMPPREYRFVPKLKIRESTGPAPGNHPPTG